MKFPLKRSSRSSGSSLIEAIIAVGVLAVAIPLVMATLAESGDSSASAEAETRCSWIVPACMDELLAAREGRSPLIAPMVAGQAFPAGGGTLALAFSEEGKAISTVSQAAYDQGLKEISGQRVRYVASLSGEPVQVAAGKTPMLRVRIVLEYPSVVPSARRKKLEFYTRLP